MNRATPYRHQPGHEERGLFSYFRSIFQKYADRDFFFIGRTAAYFFFFVLLFTLSAFAAPAERTSAVDTAASESTSETSASGQTRTSSTHHASGERITAQPTDADFRGRKILLVEDNELNQEIATEILKEAGMNGYLTKPIDVEKMMKTIASFL